MPTTTTDPRVAALEAQNRLLRASLLLSLTALVTCGGVTSHYELVTTNTLVVRDASDPHSSRDFGKDIIPHIVKHGKAVAHRFAASCVRSP